MTRITFVPDDFLDERQRRVLELLDQVRAVSPSTALWLKGGRIGLRPDVRQADRPVVDALLRGLELLYPAR